MLGLQQKSVMAATLSSGSIGVKIRIRQAPQARDYRFHHPDGSCLVLLMQVEQNSKAVFFFAYDTSFADQIIIEAEHPVIADRLGEPLDLDGLLLLCRHDVLD